MGYTVGRRLTKEFMQEEALKYKTRSDLQINDPSIYKKALYNGTLDEICSHMVIGKYSTPQMICRHIMEEVLGEECIYNGRKTIAPYELDVYFPKYKLAIEYNGKGWHHKEKVVERDGIKKSLCDKEGILLIVLIENSRDYEEDVKAQLINNLPKINERCSKSISQEEILKVSVLDVYDKLFCEEELKEKVKKCKNIFDFQRRYPNLYQKARKAKRLDLFNPIRTKREKWSEEEIFLECSKINSLSDLIQNNHGLYLASKRRGIFYEATKHMEDKGRKKFSNKTDEELILQAREINCCEKMKKENGGLKSELTNRGLYIQATAHIKRKLHWTCWRLRPEIELLDMYENLKKRNCEELVPCFTDHLKEIGLL